MKESQFGFSYSWRDLEPIRALSVVVLGAQVLGAALGFLLPRFSHWFESMWFGGALATFPAFLLGMFIQDRWKPGSLKEHKVMVLRLGLIAALLSLFAIAMPLFGFERAA
ncbi:hypothetical protein ACQQ2N_03265 [Dokdonella sp. MW10]|uniref:hypothetical protein n=1 Tax=Dokdonella sp. MW10 TaxID=2992926 RepID=UPI003F816638